MRPRWMGWTVVLGCAWVAAFSSTALALEEGPIKNGLSSRAFRRNALTTNPRALGILMSHALDNPQPVPDDAHYIADQLQDPRARAMLAEIVKCVAPRGTQVTYAGSPWKGELGLCSIDPAADPQSPGPPTWGAQGPNPTCQQVITACVMARVNAMGRSIPLRLEGEPSALFPPRDPVATETHFRESELGQDPSEGIPIGSFNGPLCLAGHECGWAPAYVGRCDAGGGKIRLGIQGSACTTTPLRICAGIHGCFGPGSGYDMPHDLLDEKDPSQAHYWEEVQPQTCAGSEITFDCPVAFGGYYSVMTRPVLSGTGIQQLPPPSPPIVQVAGSGTYPAKEKAVFTFREGAFYGNLFAPDELSWTCEMTDASTRTCSPVGDTKGDAETCNVKTAEVTRDGTATCDRVRTVPYRNVYACYSLAQQLDSQGSGSDDDGIAYLSDRICDEPHSACFPHTPKRCYYANAYTNDQKGAHCQWIGDGAYHHCESADRKTSYLTITTYLNNSCDLIGDADVCGGIRSALAVPAGATPPSAPRPRACGGCSYDGSGGSLPVSLVALLVVLRRRRGRAPGAPVRDRPCG